MYTSAKNERKLLLAYLGYVFVFASKKLGSLARILEGNFFAFGILTVIDTFALARVICFFLGGGTDGGVPAPTPSRTFSVGGKKKC